MSSGRRPTRAGVFVLAGSVVLAGAASSTGLQAAQKSDAAPTSSQPLTWSIARPHPTPAASRSTTATPTRSQSSAAPRRSPSSGSATPTHAVEPRSGSTARSGSIAASAARPFAVDSPWNTPLPAGAALDPQSDAIAKAVLTDPKLVMNVETYSFAVPFYTATASTPRVRLHGRADHGGLVPIDPSWRPNEGGDHKMNVLDPATNQVYELQGYDASARSAYWMVIRNYVTGTGDGRSSEGRRGPTGAGVSQAAGTIRIADVRRGRIDHALAFVTSAPVQKRFRYPATSTDGTSTASVGVEEGMRVRLDPKLDLASITGMSKAERMIARALQRYGAFCVDNGGGNNQALGFYAEQPTSATGDPYPSVGLKGDWVQLPHIPRSALQVVAESVTAP